MAKKADIGSKRLINLAPDAWVQWVSGADDVVAREILNTEFQWISRESDVLMKVFSPEHGEFLILNELQLRYSTKMPRRMRAYAGLAEERYGLPILPVLVNILPYSSPIPNRYESSFMGIQAMQDYQVINLWEVDANVVFERSLNTLVPFVPILSGGGDETFVRQALDVLRQDEKLEKMEPLLAFFASFVLETELVAQIMRWDMAVLRESPWYQEIEQKGEQKGETKLVLRLLTRRVGEIPPELRSQIEGLSLEQTEALGEALLDFTEQADLVGWLEAHL